MNSSDSQMYENILDEIAAYTRLRVERLKEAKPLLEIVKDALALSADTGFPFKKALSGGDIAFICEVKKGVALQGRHRRGVSISVHCGRVRGRLEPRRSSVLTEPHWFLGSNRYLREIAKAVSIPAFAERLYCGRIYDL